MPKSVDLFYKFITNIPSNIEALFSDSFSPTSVVSAIATSLQSAINGLVKSAGTQILLILGASTYVPLELSLMMIPLLADDDLTVSQKLVLIMVDTIVIMVCYAVSCVYPDFAAKPVMQVILFVIPFIFDLITKIIVNNGKTKGVTV